MGNQVPSQDVQNEPANAQQQQRKANIPYIFIRFKIWPRSEHCWLHQCRRLRGMEYHKKWAVIEIGCEKLALERLAW